MKYRVVLLALLATVLATALPFSVAAQTVHKCTVDGKISYSQAPCPAGAASASELAVPSAPAPDPAAGADLARQKAQATALETARLKRDEKLDRELDKRAQTARAHNKKCARLKLDKAAADEDTRNVTIQNEARVRARAKRAADNLALECS